MIDHTIQEGFMKETYRDMIIVDTDPKKLLEKWTLISTFIR